MQCYVFAGEYPVFHSRWSNSCSVGLTIFIHFTAFSYAFSAAVCVSESYRVWPLFWKFSSAQLSPSSKYYLLLRIHTHLGTRVFLAYLTVNENQCYTWKWRQLHLSLLDEHLAIKSLLVITSYKESPLKFLGNWSVSCLINRLCIVI